MMETNVDCVGRMDSTKMNEKSSGRSRRGEVNWRGKNLGDGAKTRGRGLSEGESEREGAKCRFRERERVRLLPKIVHTIRQGV
jgi:hypothetical protein